MASIRTLCHSGILLENGSVKYSGDVEATVNKYLEDNTFKGGALIDTVKVNTPTLSLNEIVVNDNERNEIHFEGTAGMVSFQISGITSIKQKFAFEAYLFDNRQNLLASYTPSFNTLNLINVEEGTFEINEKFSLPPKMASGEYYLFWSLTHPKVQCLTECIEPIKIVVRNVAYLDGTPCDYKYCGLICL